MTGYTHVVPLGLSCRVTYQVRAYFRSGERYPFDWWTTPLEGIARYLRDPDPARIFAEGALEEQLEDGWVRSIVSSEFGFELFHEFTRRKEAPAMRVVSPDWRGQVPSVRARHVARLERLLGLNRTGNRILFVRHRVDAADEGARAPDNVAGLWQALLGLWPAAEIELLLVNVPPFDPPSRRVRRLAFDDPPGPPPESWRGDDWRWAAGLASAGLVPPRGLPPLKRPPSPVDQAL